MEFGTLRVFRTSEVAPENIVNHLTTFEADIAQAQASVNTIIARVRNEGDEAVLTLTREFDWPLATLDALKVTEEDMDRAMAEIDPEFIGAMTLAAEHIRRFHQRQMPKDFFEEFEYGLMLGQRHTPVDSVACYVPTRKASLVSTLLMTVVPAQVAGVPRIIVVGPCNAEGKMPTGVLAAAHLLGVTEMYKLGGAVATAAMALGTATFPRVDKIVGPTNIFGTLAKRALYGEVGIDGLYGPSDVTIVADGSVPAELVATDLLSQAEHGEDSPAFLVTPDEGYALKVADEVGRQVQTSPRAQYLTNSLSRYGAIIITRDMDDAAEMANRLAPEHLELMVADPKELLNKIRHAGAIFMGGYTPVPVGDFFAGPSHMLPTGRTARFSNGLGVMDFLTRSSLIQTNQSWLQQHAAAITAFADHEGLDAHGQAVTRRV